MKKLRLRKSVLVLFSVLILMFGAILISPKISKSLKEVLSVKEVKNVSFDGYDTYASATDGDDLHGTWSLSSTFLGNNFQSFEEDSQLLYTGNGSDFNESLTDKIDVQFNVSYEYGTATMNFDPSEVSISVPVFLFSTVDISECVFDYDADNNKIVFTKDGVEIGSIDLGDLVPVDYDNLGSTGQAFGVDLGSIEYGELVLINDQTLSKDDSIDFSFTIGYNFAPYYFYVEDYISELNPYIYAFDLEDPDDYGLFFGTYLVTAIEVEGGNVPSTLTFRRNDAVLYDSWQNEWGTNSGYNDDYYFLEYSVYSNVRSANSFDISFAVDGDGTIVAFGDETEYITGSDLSTGEFNPCNSTFDSISCDIDSGTYILRNVVVAYQKPSSGNSNDTYYEIEVTVNGESSSYTWDYTYTNSQIDIQYPAGVSYNVLDRAVETSEANVAITKLKQGKDFEVTFLVEAGTDTINKDNNGNTVKAFNIWNLTNDGTSDVDVNLVTNKVYLSNSLSDSGTLEVLNSGDYDVVSMYPQDDREYDYIEGTEQYVLKENNQYSSYTEKQIYVLIDNTWEAYGTYKKGTSGIVYTSVEGTTRVVSESDPIVLPEGTKDVNVLYAGSKAAVYVGYNVTYKVSGTSHVKGLVEELETGDVILKNKAKVLFNSEDKKEVSAGTTLYELESESFLNVSGVVKERVNNSDTISYTVSGFEQIFYGNDLDSALELINKQDDAIFYVLLPEGGEVSNVKVSYYQNDELSNVNSTVTPNYFDGRSLLKVTFTRDANELYQVELYSDYIRFGYTLTYDLSYSAVANQTYGTTLLSDIVYTADDLSSGYDSVLDLPSTSFSSGSVQNGLKNLDVNNRMMADNITKTVEPITVGVGAYHKEANVSSVNESKEYSYTLQYSYSSQLDSIKNVLFVDVLDSANTDSNYFKGILKNIDTSYLNDKGVSTTVYYTTSTIDINNVDINDSIWSTTAPSNLENVKAIAVSTGNYEFTQANNIAPKIVINMIAPNAFVDSRTLVANNQSLLKYINFSNNSSVLRSDITSVTLNKANITLDMNYRNTMNDLNNEGKGSSSNPIIISGNYGYYVTLKNNDSVSYDNVSFMNALPETLSLDGDIVSVEDVAFTKVENGNNIKISLSELEANQELHFWIPVTVIDETNFDVMDDVISINILGNRNYSGTQIHVYTKAAVPVLEFDKYVKTISNGTYDKDEVFILKNNETYSYKITVENTSVLDAKNVEVIDNVPEDLIVVENTITNGGIYNSTNNTIKWIVDVNHESSVDLTYSVTLPSDAELGTYYNSHGHVTYNNPLNVSNKLYDDDTNSISVYYQVVSDITIKNNITGAIGDKTKSFNYVISLDGEASHVGNYDVINGEREKVGTITLDSDGNGEYIFALKGDEQITIKLLPGNISYTIAQSEAPGYTTTNNVNSSNTINGLTDADGNVSYVFTNNYYASGTTRINAKVTYDKEISAGMFAVSLEDPNGETTDVSIDGEGNVIFNNITLANVVGSYNYVLKQINTNVKQVSYDNREFTAKLDVTDNKDGNLDIQVSYYDNNGEEVSSVIFENEYVPLGLTIVNNNNSKYVNPDKEFNYIVNVTDAEPGIYEIIKNKNNIGSLEVLDDGTGTTNITLKSNEAVTIVDLNTNSHYEIKQEMVEYYETSTTNGVVEDTFVVASGEVLDDSVQVEFINTYNTTATFKPESRVVLEEKLLEDKEFTFALVDISTGATNGYSDEVSNDENGLLDFKEIVYDRPGTYVYRIAQVKGASNHIYYDLTTCLLTITLTDNGNGTMSYEYVYNYENGKTEFVNKYSVDPIVVEPEPNEGDGPVNPNTIDYIIVVILSLILIINIIIIQRGSRVRKYSS